MARASQGRYAAFRAAEKLRRTRRCHYGDFRGSRYGKRPAEYAARKEKFAENVFKAVERYEPGLRAKVGKYVSSTPLTHLPFNGSEDGTSYGL